MCDKHYYFTFFNQVQFLSIIEKWLALIHVFTEASLLLRKSSYKHCLLFVVCVYLCQYLRPPVCLQIQLTADSRGALKAKWDLKEGVNVWHRWFNTLLWTVEESTSEDKHSGFHLENWVQQCKHGRSGIHAEKMSCEQFSSAFLCTEVFSEPVELLLQYLQNQIILFEKDCQSL